MRRQVAALLGGCVGEPGIPGSRDRDGAAVDEIHTQRVIAHRDALRPGRSGSQRPKKSFQLLTRSVWCSSSRLYIWLSSLRLNPPLLAKPDRLEPELGRAVVTLDMNMHGLVPVSGVEEKAIGALLAELYGISYLNTRNHRSNSFFTPGVSFVRRHWSAAFFTTSPWVG